MNKQIQELAKQAGIFYYRKGKLQVDTEKFAELIVRECISVINQPNGVGDDDVIKISMDVKKHFGVE